MQMPRRAEIVDYARSMIGTPFQHQGRVAGRAMDCGGLVEEVADHFGIKPEGFVFEGYSTFPRPKFVFSMLTKYLGFVGGLKNGLPADVLLVADHGYAMHLGILAERDCYRTIIHSSRKHGGVTEHIIDAAFEREVRSVWRYPGVTD